MVFGAQWYVGGVVEVKEKEWEETAGKSPGSRVWNRIQTSILLQPVHANTTFAQQKCVYRNIHAHVGARMWLRRVSTEAPSSQNRQRRAASLSRSPLLALSGSVVKANEVVVSCGFGGVTLNRGGGYSHTLRTARGGASIGAVHSACQLNSQACQSWGITSLLQQSFFPATATTSCSEQQALLRM